MALTGGGRRGSWREINNREPSPGMASIVPPSSITWTALFPTRPAISAMGWRLSTGTGGPAAIQVFTPSCATLAIPLRLIIVLGYIPLHLQTATTQSHRQVPCLAMNDMGIYRVVATSTPRATRTTRFRIHDSVLSSIKYGAMPFGRFTSPSPAKPESSLFMIRTSGHSYSRRFSLARDIPKERQSKAFIPDSYSLTPRRPEARMKPIMKTLIVG